jgi:hypothetical protein
MHENKVILNPRNEVIFESSLNKLVKKVRGD